VLDVSKETTETRKIMQAGTEQVARRNSSGALVKVFPIPESNPVQDLTSNFGLVIRVVSDRQYRYQGCVEGAG
jgi:hypothetical protein